MPILAPEALLCENQNIQWKMLPPVGIEPGPLITSDSKSNTILSLMSILPLLPILSNCEKPERQQYFNTLCYKCKTA